MIKTVIPIFPRLLTSLSIPVLWTLLLSPAAAQSGVMETEIDFLIDQVGRDRCNFIRNDRRYLGREARAHLQSKRERNSAQFSSAEEFIEKIASHSETTGQPYLIRCARRFQFTANEWFSMLLENYRSKKS